MAAALVEMAASFAPEQDRADEVAARARELRRELLSLGERELSSYAPVLEALRLSRDDPSRAERGRAARWEAAAAPLEIARACSELATLGREIASSGSPHLVGDALAGAELAGASCRAAVRLVQLNLHDAPSDDPRVIESHDLWQSAPDSPAPSAKDQS